MIAALVIAIALIVIVFSLIVVYGTFKPYNPSTPKSIFYSPGVGESRTRPDCNAEKTGCSSNEDCEDLCVNDEEMVCYRPPGGEAAVGPDGGYCLPSKVLKEGKCDPQKGGVWVWTGFQNTGNQAWTCYCSYPDYYGGDECKQLNPGVCSAPSPPSKSGRGTFGYDASTQKRAPSSWDCECPKGTVRLNRGDVNTPFCVDSKLANPNPALPQITYYQGDAEF